MSPIRSGEASPPARIGGAILGGFAVTVFAAVRHWDAMVPVPALLLAVGSALAVGAAAGIYPALKAARLAPAEGLRTF